MHVKPRRVIVTSLHAFAKGSQQEPLDLEPPRRSALDRRARRHQHAGRSSARACEATVLHPDSGGALVGLAVATREAARQRGAGLPGAAHALPQPLPKAGEAHALGRHGGPGACGRRPRRLLLRITERAETCRLAMPVSPAA